MSAVRGGRKTADGPLYVQVRDLLMKEIHTGAWMPGEMLPNEFELAAAFGVSQGTMRKALDSLAREHVLVRRQGIGTFVSEHTPAEVLFRFFQFRDQQGRRVIPESRTLRTTVARANKEEQAKLGLPREEPVIRHLRVRLNAGRPFIYERIVLPEKVFPGLSNDRDLPNTLYDKFQREFGVTVAHASEQIGAQTAKKREADLLGLPLGAPLLKIDRRTIALDGRIIEWRHSLCHVEGLYYAVEVG